jgi:hypothetical protein
MSSDDFKERVGNYLAKLKLKTETSVNDLAVLSELVTFIATELIDRDQDLVERVEELEQHTEALERRSRP